MYAAIQSSLEATEAVLTFAVDEGLTVGYRLAGAVTGLAEGSRLMVKEIWIYYAVVSARNTLRPSHMMHCATPDALMHWAMPDALVQRSHAEH